MPTSINMQSGLAGQIRQKGWLMLLTMPASVPSGPPGLVPGISSVPKIEYEAKITLKIIKTAIIMYRDCPSFELVLSVKFRCLSLADLRIRVSTSWYMPKGQSQPQNAPPQNYGCNSKHTNHDGYLFQPRSRVHYFIASGSVPERKNVGLQLPDGAGDGSPVGVVACQYGQRYAIGELVA